MKAHLVCRSAARTKLEFELAQGESVLGRDPGLAVTLPIAGVSRRHARVVHDGRSYWLEDLKSTNGTFLNGEQVSRERLRHLDVITLGKAADLVFLLREAAARPARRQGIVAAALLGEDGAAIPLAVGETTLGRAEVCNIAIDNGAVSKVHARVLRSAEQLSIEDLGSANGTFVNRARVTTAVLGDGDELSLGGVVRLRVQLERGEVEVTVAERPAAPVARTAPAERPAFSQEWKTRFEWNEEEQAEIAAFQRQIRERDAARAAAAAAPEAAGRAHKPAAAAGKPAGPKPAAAAKPEPVPAKPVAPAEAAPTPKPPPAAAPPQPAPRPQAPPPAQAAAPPRPAPPAEPAAPAVAAPQPTRPEPPPPAAPAQSGGTRDEPLAATLPSGRAVSAPIREVRLAGAGFDVAVTEPGPHALGRATGAPLRIDHPTVSRRHAQILLSDDRHTVWVQDMGGANGTRVNGAAVTGLTVLHDGDRVGVGEVELSVALKRA